jgi:hypothetical protein
VAGVAASGLGAEAMAEALEVAAPGLGNAELQLAEFVVIAGDQAGVEQTREGGPGVAGVVLALVEGADAELATDGVLPEGIGEVFGGLLVGEIAVVEEEDLDVGSWGELASAISAESDDGGVRWESAREAEDECVDAVRALASSGESWQRDACRIRAAARARA